MRPSALRFFLVVAGPSATYLAVAAAVIAFAVYLVRMDPGGFDQVLPITLFLQLFAASTGYRERLCRGHMDPILTGGVNPWRVASAHWAISIGLGVCVWVLLGVIEVIGKPGQWPSSLTPAGIVVLLYLSTVVWAASLLIGRNGGAVLWLVILFGLAATQQLQRLRVMFNPDAETWADVLHSTGSVLVFPVFLLLDPTKAGPSTLWLSGLATVAVWMIGAAVIATLEAPLREA